MKTNDLQLSPDQVAAKELTSAWLTAHSEGRGDKLLLRIFGYAGTGKTTIIRSLLEDFPKLNCCFGAYTGKAALVMQKQGLPARTVHSLIYRPVPPNKKKCDELLAKIKEATDKPTKDRLYAELNSAQKVGFELRPPEDSPLGFCKLLVLDECSMVNEKMLADLLSFKVPIIALGDPGQLPPIEGAGAIINEEPDVLLKQIHRQAKGDPIIDFATRARNRIAIPYGDRGTARKIKRKEFTKEMAMSSDQILVGMNKTRRAINSYVRSLRGRDTVSQYPTVGEKVICLANDRITVESFSEHVPIFNGMMGVVTEVVDHLEMSIMLKVQFDPIDPVYEKPIEIKALRAHFDVYEDKDALKSVRWWDKRDNQEFDFGYAITVHKAQGSQWDSVVMYDDGFLAWNWRERAKWEYTGITRAAKDLTIVNAKA